MIVDAGESAKHLEPWEWSWPRAAGYSWYLVLDSRAERSARIDVIADPEHLRELNLGVLGD